jgi:hypothetical protein
LRCKWNSQRRRCWEAKIHERVSCFVPSSKVQMADSEKEASGGAPGAAKEGKRKVFRGR